MSYTNETDETIDKITEFLKKRRAAMTRSVRIRNDINVCIDNIFEWLEDTILCDFISSFWAALVIATTRCHKYFNKFGRFTVFPVFLLCSYSIFLVLSIFFGSIIIAFGIIGYAIFGSILLFCWLFKIIFLSKSIKL
jgi:hypothetical protein